MAAVQASAFPVQEPATGRNAGSRLAALPEEILSNISIKLQSDDIFALRQTCRDVENKCLHEFAKEYFQEKCFMYTTESLKVLLHISHSTKLRGYLRHIYFITALFKERPKRCEHDCLGHCWHPTLRQCEAFIIYLRDQKNLRESKGARALLINALSKLPRLKGLSLVDSTHEVPLAAEVRGLSKFVRTTGTVPHYAPNEHSEPGALTEYFKWLTHCWRLLLVAIAESGIRTLTAVELKTRSHVHGISPIDDLKFRPDTFEKLKIAFSGLEIFSVQFRSYNLRKGALDAVGINNLARARKGIQDFTPVLSNVTNFRWSFDLHDGSAGLCKALAGALDLSRLKKIKFDSIAIDSRILGTIVSKLTSTGKLSLHAVDLTSGSWVTILKIIKHLPQLEHLHLEYLQQSRQKVYFLKKSAEGVLVDSIWGPMGPIPYDEEEADWSDGFDDGPPDLIPQDEVEEPILNHTVQEGVEKSVSDLQKAVPEDEHQDVTVHAPVAKKCSTYEHKEYKAPGHELRPERGYFICLPSREEITQQLPVFIDEFNLGPNLEDHFVGMQGLLAALGGPVGGPAGGIVLPMPPIPPFMGQPAGPPAPPPQGAPPPQAANPGQQAAPQGGGNALNTAQNQLFAGGPPPGHHHHTFNIPMPPFGPFPAPNIPMAQAVPGAQPTNNAAAAAAAANASAPAPAGTPAATVDTADDGPWVDEGEWVDDID